jgi:UDP-glucose 4-epimerase
VNEVAEEVLVAVARQLGAIQNGTRTPIVHVPMRPGEEPGAVVKADTSTLAALGMAPADLTPLGPGIKETVEWYADHWLPEYLDKVAAARG